MSSRHSGRVPGVFLPPQSAPSEESSLPNSWVSNSAVRWDCGNFKTQKVDVVCFGSSATSSRWEAPPRGIDSQNKHLPHLRESVALGWIYLTSNQSALHQNLSGRAISSILFLLRLSVSCVARMLARACMLPMLPIDGGKHLRRSVTASTTGKALASPLASYLPSLIEAAVAPAADSEKKKCKKHAPLVTSTSMTSSSSLSNTLNTTTSTTALAALSSHHTGSLPMLQGYR
ncbi:hypothetical protein K438DRAFT_1781713 [Mycena galopus ATCC 62051]|nr:hypothetical protein K438DRAFT_1781713 [Mycena galopus ATCC 62051]